MRRETKYIVIHCSATAPSSDIGADEIDSWHKKRGWDGIGYHVVIRRDGRVEFGRHFDDVGAHVRGWNTRSVGVCMVGGVDADGTPEDNFTQEQYDTLVATVVMLERAYPDAGVVGHRDLSPDKDGDGVIEPHEWLKACPSFDVSKWRVG
jgi:N-acetyl-anhydromuramyl-L-alanine amidase AmpD